MIIIMQLRLNLLVLIEMAVDFTTASSLGFGSNPRSEPVGEHKPQLLLCHRAIFVKAHGSMD